MRRAALVCLPLAFVVGGCSSAAAPTTSIAVLDPTSPSAPTHGSGTTTAEWSRAQDLVVDLYAGLSRSSGGGPTAVATFVAERNHPLYDYPADQCLAYIESFDGTDAYRFTSTPDVGRLAPDPGWQIPQGRDAAGEVPAGDLYAVPIVVVESDVDLHQRTTVDRHVAVLGDVAYFFQPCEGDEPASGLV